MIAPAIPSQPIAPRWFAFEEDPNLVRMIRAVPGRLLLLVLSAGLLQPSTSLWPAIALAIAAMSFTARRHAATVATVATLGVFAISPNWYGTSAATIIADRARLTDWLTPALRWGAPCLVLGFAAIFLAAVRAGRPRLASRHPLLCLLAIYFALLISASSGLGDSTASVWLWSVVAAFGGYMWFIALIATEQRNRNSRVPFLHQFGVLHPFWGSSAVPLTIAPYNLGKIGASNDDALAISQIKGFKLLVWADIIVVIRGIYAIAVHQKLGIPTFEIALQASIGPGLPWHLRWLSLISDFFEFTMFVASWGNTIVACARLAGYNLPRSTYRPFTSRSIAEFWGRSFYYYKEILLKLFYFPTYLTRFRTRPRLRAAFATFMAAGVGNLLFHFIISPERVAKIGLWQALAGSKTFAIYCAVLSAGIAVSQLRGQRRRPAGGTLLSRTLSLLGIMAFYCLLHIFDDPLGMVPLFDHLRFFLSLFLIHQ
jgi:hypothetical protein